MKTSKQERQAENAHFAAANSGGGFVSFYPELFDAGKIRRRYIIKGGPGTGKSSFMRTVADYAGACGRDVSLYYCSSDPDSLDAVVIDGEIVVADGTAPHTMDAEIPGARDEIVNLGVFWDGEKLAEQYNEITALGALKSGCYRRAYRYLSGCQNLREIQRDLTAPALRMTKLNHAVQRILREIPSGDGFCLTPGFCDSIGMKGRVRLDTEERRAKKLFVSEDHYHIAPVFLSAILAGAAEKGLRVRVCYDPLHPEDPESVYLEESGICFVIGGAEEQATLTGRKDDTVRVNMKRFADADLLRTIRSEYRSAGRLYDALLGSATDALKRAGEYHFRLEKIYGACMDFEAQGRFAASFCRRIVD